MRKLYMGMVVLALAALPAALAAQENAPPHRAMRAEMRMGMFFNPAEMVLQHQSDLNLTPDQMEKLGKIRDHFREENGEELAKAQKDWDEIATKYGPPPYSDETREKVMHERQEAHKKFSKLFDNQRKAREEAMEVLSADQRTRLMADMRMRMDRDQDQDRH